MAVSPRVGPAAAPFPPAMDLAEELDDHHHHQYNQFDHGPLLGHDDDPAFSKSIPGGDNHKQLGLALMGVVASIGYALATSVVATAPGSHPLLLATLQMAAVAVFARSATYFRLLGFSSATSASRTQVAGAAGLAATALAVHVSALAFAGAALTQIVLLATLPVSIVIRWVMERRSMSNQLVMSLAAVLVCVCAAVAGNLMDPAEVSPMADQPIAAVAAVVAEFAVASAVLVALAFPSPSPSVLAPSSASAASSASSGTTRLASLRVAASLSTRLLPQVTELATGMLLLATLVVEGARVALGSESALAMSPPGPLALLAVIMAPFVAATTASSVPRAAQACATVPDNVRIVGVVLAMAVVDPLGNEPSAAMYTALAGALVGVWSARDSLQRNGAGAGNKRLASKLAMGAVGLLSVLAVLSALRPLIGSGQSHRYPLASEVLTNTDADGSGPPTAPPLPVRFPLASEVLRDTDPDGSSPPIAPPLPPSKDKEALPSRPKVIPAPPLKSPKHMVDFGMELVVFYGRRQTVSILHSYIERNLVDRGGMIHKVHFVVHTEDAADLAFLDQLLARQPRYVRVALEARNQMDFSVHYEWLPRDRLMFKIDDDVVFIEDGAFEAMLEEKLRNRFLFVSANVVNHPVLSTVHAQMAALVPYAPANGRDPWIRGDPLRRKHGAFGDGPDLAKFNDGACTWGSWKCAAVSHENFLHDANAGQLDRYHFPVWDFHAYDTAVRWSINAFVFNTDDILGKINSTDDEQLIAVEFSKQRNWHSGAAGKAIMAHYAYYPQREGLNTNTGLIDRYRALAKRMCGYVLNEDGEYNVEY